MEFNDFGNLHETNGYPSNQGGWTFWETPDIEVLIDLSWKMLKNGLNLNFLGNGFKDFANIGNLNEMNNHVLTKGDLVFWKILDLELWIDSGWSKVRVLNPFWIIFESAG